MKNTQNTPITFYISNSTSNPEKGVKLIAESFNDIEFIALEYNKFSRYSIFIDTIEQGIISITDYKTMLRENGIKDAAFFWSFLEKVRREVKKSGDKNSLKTVFNDLPFKDRVKTQELYYALSNKLSCIIWDAAEDFEKKNPDFYISEDGMMDLIPYLMTLGEKRVNTFFNKPHLALKTSQKDWEYPFNLCSVFLYFNKNKDEKVK